MIRIPGKIPITIRPLFWLVAFFIGWMWTLSLVGALVSVGVIFFSVLFHEFGHALTATLFQQKTSIELAAFGGFTYRTGRKLKLWEEFFVVLNGPIAGLLLACIAYYLYSLQISENIWWQFILRFAYVANFFWTIINLVPVLPLDGGHLMSIILESIFGFRGVKWSIILGLVIAVLISIVFFVMGQFLVGALFLILTFESFRSLRYYKIFSEKDRDQDLQNLMKEAEAFCEKGSIDEALRKYEQIRQTAQRGILYTMATQEVARIYKQKGEVAKAYELLLPLRKNLSAEYLPLLHFLAFVNGDITTTLKVGNDCYQANPSYETALINACANAVLCKIEPTIGWLECCIRDNIPSIQEALSRPEFDAIRENKKFQSFVQKVSTTQ